MLVSHGYGPFLTEGHLSGPGYKSPILSPTVEVSAGRKPLCDVPHTALPLKRFFALDALIFGPVASFPGGEQRD